MARAIIAGAGELPALLLEAGPAHLVVFDGVTVEATGATVISARFEQLGGLFAKLREMEIDELCLAGAMSRPRFDPVALDPQTAALLPRLVAAMAQGDDALLRTVIDVLEAEGFAVRAAQDLRPDLVAESGTLAGDPSDAARADAARGRDVLQALGPHDVGQGVVVADGQILGIETLQGTDAMLAFVGATRPASGGVFIKRPKPGQDLRVDVPAIGPDTLARVADAGLSGIEVSAGGVLLLNRDVVLSEAERLDLSIWAVP